MNIWEKQILEKFREYVREKCIKTSNVMANHSYKVFETDFDDFIEQEEKE